MRAHKTRGAHFSVALLDPRSMPTVLAASDWLALAADSGYCAKILPGGGAGDCIAGDRGSWSLKATQTHSVLEAAAACLDHCAGCNRCNYITISTEWKHCSWHHQCTEPLLDDAPSFISGASHKKAAQSAAHNMTAAPGHNRSDAVKGEPARKRDLRSQIARVKYSFLACPKGAAPPPTAELDDWMDSPRNSFLAGYAALHHAACCGGVGVMPRINSEQSSRDPKRNTMVGVLGARQKACYSFEHIPQVSESPSQCLPQLAPAHVFLARGSTSSACPSSMYYSHPAMLALMDYLKLPETLPCPADIDFDKTFVAHIKSFDVDNDFEDGSAGMDQPPLSFYTSAWKASGLDRLLLISQSDDTPVLRLMAMMADSMGPPKSVSTLYGKGLAANLAALMCARHLVVSRSSWSAMLLMNDKLESVYSPVPIAHAVTASCKTVVKVPSFMDRGGVGSTGGWASIANQKMEQITRSWNISFKFKQQKEPRVQCMAGATGPASSTEL